MVKKSYHYENLITRLLKIHAEKFSLQLEFLENCKEYQHSSDLSQIVICNFFFINQIL